MDPSSDKGYEALSVSACPCDADGMHICIVLSVKSFMNSVTFPYWEPYSPNKRTKQKYSEAGLSHFKCVG